MINKNNLKGKWVSYFNQGQREGRVVKIVGNTLTVQNAIGERKRIHPKKFRILGVYYRKKLVEIEWK